MSNAFPEDYNTTASLPTRETGDLIPASDHNDKRDAILAVEQKVGKGDSSADNATTGQVLKKQADGSTAWDDEAGDAGPHSHTSEDIIDFDEAVEANTDVAANTTHRSATDNPHSVTKAQVGLGNADNTSDLAKPVSTATQAALNDKADDTDLTAHTGNTDNPHDVTKVQVGLENVTNDAQVKLSDKASQAEAEGGTNNTKWMTPLRTKQAIDQFASEAGEANTASNVGVGGEGIFKQKNGVDLEFKTLLAGDNITLTPTVNDEVEIAATVGEGEGEGDMLASVYDPNEVEADAFDMDNMAEGADTKILTNTERTKLAGIEAGAEVNEVSSEDIADFETTSELNDRDTANRNRDNHTGTQTANTISDFDTQVRTNRLDQMAPPTEDVSLNTNKLTNVVDPTADQDAATKKYVDDEIASIEPGGGASELDDLSDVDTTGASDDDVLTFDDGTWVPKPAPGAGGGRPTPLRTWARGRVKSLRARKAWI